MEEERMIKLFTKKRNKKGFTLIELIVVIAILGILAAIAIPKFTGVRGTANQGVAVNTVTIIQRAAEMAATTNNVALTNVTVNQIETVMGVTIASYNGKPTGATYGWTAPNATVTGIAVPGNLTASFNFSQINP